MAVKKNRTRSNSKSRPRTIETDGSNETAPGPAASRRTAIKGVAAAGGLVAGGRALDHWIKPVVDSVVLPAHAESSPGGCIGGEPVIFGSNDSYEIPDGVIEIFLEGGGGDGGGGGAGGGEGGAAGGDGEEGAFASTTIPVSPGQVYNIVVGERGAGGGQGTGEAGGAGASGGEGEPAGETGETGVDAGSGGGGGGGAGGTTTVALEGGGTVLTACGGFGGGGGGGGISGAESGEGASGGEGGTEGGDGGAGGTSLCGEGSGEIGGSGGLGTAGGLGDDGFVRLVECPDGLPEPKGP